MSVVTHQLTHLSHLHERWVQFIIDRVHMPDKRTVQTLGTLKDYPIFSEFISAGQSVLNLHFPGSEVTGGWGTLLMPGIESDWHHHSSKQRILVYYPQEQQGDLHVIPNPEKHRENPSNEAIANAEVIHPAEGLCVIYGGMDWHKIMPNPMEQKLRISLVLTATNRGKK